MYTKYCNIPRRRSPERRANTVGTWLSLVERTLGVGEVASSNLVVPTIYFRYYFQQITDVPVRFTGSRDFTWSWLTGIAVNSSGTMRVREI